MPRPPQNPRRKVDGYIWRQELNRAIRANEEARKALARLLRDSDAGSPVTRATLYALISQALGDNLQALMELIRIDTATAENGGAQDDDAQGD